MKRSSLLLLPALGLLVNACEKHPLPGEPPRVVHHAAGHADAHHAAKSHAPEHHAPPAKAEPAAATPAPAPPAEAPKEPPKFFPDKK